MKIKIKCDLCDKLAVVMIKVKNNGKNFYCAEHYLKKKKQNERN